MNWITRVAVLCLAGCAHGPMVSGNSLNSADSSGNSSNASGNSSGNSSGASNNSANSSGNSTQSSGDSMNSSNNSNASTQATSNNSQGSSAGSSQQSSNATTNESTSAPSSQIVMGSALLTAVAGGVVLTVFSVKWRHEARMERERLKRLQLEQQQQQQRQETPPPPPPDPEFEPAPFPPPTTEKEPGIDDMVLARAWLLANELQLKQDLALGWGPALEDLAGIAGIDPAHHERFGALLRAHRREFPVTPALTPQQAAQLMARIGDLVMTDALLRADAVASLAAW